MYGVLNLMINTSANILPGFQSSISWYMGEMQVSLRMIHIQYPIEPIVLIQELLGTQLIIA
jgi:hypothetical protein